MFTGIVEALGSVAAVEPARGLTRLRISAPSLAREVRPGDSLAVNGCCLTAVSAAAGQLAFEAVAETLARTNLGELDVGAAVNLERALRADGRLDGHLVQGHVDGTGRVRELRRAGPDVRLFVDCGPELRSFLVEKGSVAVDGVSLTLAGVDASGFHVALIPHTLEATTLGARRAGDRVNLEADVLAKYVARFLERTRGQGPA